MQMRDSKCRRSRRQRVAAQPQVRSIRSQPSIRLCLEAFVLCICITMLPCRWILLMLFHIAEKLEEDGGAFTMAAINDTGNCYSLQVFDNVTPYSINNHPLFLTENAYVVPSTWKAFRKLRLDTHHCQPSFHLALIFLSRCKISEAERAWQHRCKTSEAEEAGHSSTNRHR